MGDYSGIGQAIAGFYIFAVVSAVVSWPLAIWKLVEISIYLWQHIHWGAP